MALNGRVSARARNIAGQATISPCLPGDRILGPKGQVLYHEPSVMMTGWSAYAFKIGGRPVAVVVFRPGQPTALLYCSGEGDTCREEMRGLSYAEHMQQATQRVCDLIAENLQSPRLEDAEPLNVMPV